MVAPHSMAQAIPATPLRVITVRFINSIKPLNGKTDEPVPPGGTPFDDRESKKQISINALSIYASTVKGSGIQVEEIDRVMAECYKVGRKVYTGAYDEGNIPF